MPQFVIDQVKDESNEFYIEGNMSVDDQGETTINKNDYFEISRCEERKELSICTTMEDAVRMIKLNVHIKNLCTNKKVAICVQLLSCSNSKMVAQKGLIAFTGDSEKNDIDLLESIYFAVPSNLCDKVGKMYFNLVTNYISYEM